MRRILDRIVAWWMSRCRHNGADGRPPDDRPLGQVRDPDAGARPVPADGERMKQK
jgi:hypothetical protein